jgi:hypothetical protein
MKRYSWELQRGLAEQKVSPARTVLEPKGIEVTVDVYTCSLRTVIEAHAAKRDVHFVMMRAERGPRMIGFLRSAASLSGLLKQPGIPPVVLLNPDRGV